MEKWKSLKHHHVIYFPRRVGDSMVFSEQLCLKCFREFPWGCTTNCVGYDDESICREVEVIAKAIIQRYLKDFSFIVCSMCEMEFIDFVEIFRDLSENAVDRKNTIELLQRRVPVGFLCCDCYKQVRGVRSTLINLLDLLFSELNTTCVVCGEREGVHWFGVMKTDPRHPSRYFPYWECDECYYK